MYDNYEWEKDGNIWTKFAIIDIPDITDINVSVYEDVPEGYECDHYDASTAVEAMFDGNTIRAELENDHSIIFPVNPKTLTVEKTVSGRSGNRNKRFDFTVTFDRDVYLNSTTNLAAGEIYEFSLAHGETVTLSNIPAGTGYTINEADYRVEGYSVVSNNATGTLNRDMLAEFNNVNDPLIPTGMYIDRNAAASGTIAVLAILMLLLLQVRKKLNIETK